MATTLPTSQQIDRAGLGYKVQDLDASGNISIAGNLVRTSQINVPLCGQAKVGATAGWVITGGTNKSHATLPASQTSSTLVVPFPPLPVGSTVTAVAVAGQVESAGATATLTMDFRSQTNAAADNTDASVATTGAVNFTAQTVISASNVGVTGQTAAVTAGKEFYVLITGTTAALTDFDLTHLLITYTSV